MVHLQTERDIFFKICLTVFTVKRSIKWTLTILAIKVLGILTGIVFSENKPSYPLCCFRGYWQPKVLRGCNSGGTLQSLEKSAYL